MRTVRIAAIAALIVVAGCSGSGSHLAPASGTNGANSSNGTSGTTPTSTMTITITRQSAAAAKSRIAQSSTRKPQVIPSTATSVDAQVWAGSTVSDSSRIASSCVNFSAGATTETLTITVPQGQDAIQLTSYDGACTSAGGQGTTGQGDILSQFIGAGTVGVSSTDIGAVFHGATGAVSLLPYALYSGANFQAYKAQSIASTFQYPSLYGYNGNGMTVAIVIGSGVDPADLSAYLTANLVPTTGRTITYESVDGASTGVNTTNGNQGEATLDLETIAALAPGANIVVYVVPDLTDQALVDAYNLILSDVLNAVHPVNVVSMSYGGCEPSTTNNAASIAFATGVAAPYNMTYFASSGDQGSTCYNGSQIPGVNHPAADTSVIAVGGNETYNTTTPVAELTNPVVWKDSFFGSPDGTGGGPSGTFPIPSYQASLGGIVSSTYRNVPDISMPAEGTLINLMGATSIYGGTSWSAPEAAAMFADIYSYCGRALTNSPQISYAAYAARTSNFIDVTSGNNQYSPTVGSIAYSAGVGYDDASGLGLPLGMKIAESMCPNHTPIANFSGALAAAPAVATPAPAASLTVAAKPIAGNLSDMGAQSGSATVNFQLGLRPTANLAANEQAVVNALQSAGFTVKQRFATHLVVDASGTSAAVASFFGTTIHTVNQPSLGARYAPVGTVTIPASLAPYVLDANLETVVRVQTGPHLITH